MRPYTLSSGKLIVLGLLACFVALPGFAFASGGITEFSSPLEQVVNTITGPAGKWISIVAMALCGVIFIMNNDATIALQALFADTCRKMVCLQLH